MQECFDTYGMLLKNLQDISELIDNLKELFDYF